jgi:hypothetical protein
MSILTLVLTSDFSPETPHRSLCKLLKTDAELLALATTPLFGVARADF